MLKVLPSPLFLIAALWFGYASWDAVKAYEASRDVTYASAVDLVSGSADVIELGGDDEAGFVDLTALLARPLFAEDRRPYVSAAKPEVAAVAPAPEPEVASEPAPAATPAPPAPPPSLTLLGTYFEDDWQALVAIAEDGQEHWLAKGDVIADWMVTDIRAEKVILQFKDRETVVVLTR